MSRRGQKIYWGAFILDWFKLLQDSELTSTDYKVIFYICSNMNNENNQAHLKQKDIATGLHIDKGNTSKSIKKLMAKQFITKISTGFMVNPHLFYIGKGRRPDREDLRYSFYEQLIKNDPESQLKYYLDEDSNELIKDENLIKKMYRSYLAQVLEIDSLDALDDYQ